jgi:hypothetical protein
VGITVNEVPVKTAAGAAELAHRARGLSQRHRTLLLLVDGRRNMGQILDLAKAAGVAPAIFDELLALELVAVPLVDAADPLGTDHIDLPLASAPVADSSLPTQARSLSPESGGSTPAGATPGSDVDRSLEEARELLMRAIRAQAPVSGSLTLLKLRRASSRADLEALLEEVEQRLREPHRTIVATQTMRHVRHLLGLPGPRTR